MYMSTDSLSINTNHFLHQLSCAPTREKNPTEAMISSMMAQISLSGLSFFVAVEGRGTKVHGPLSLYIYYSQIYTYSMMIKAVVFRFNTCKHSWLLEHIQMYWIHQQVQLNIPNQTNQIDI